MCSRGKAGHPRPARALKKPHRDGATVAAGRGGGGCGSTHRRDQVWEGEDRKEARPTDERAKRWPIHPTRQRASRLNENHRMVFGVWRQNQICLARRRVAPHGGRETRTSRLSFFFSCREEKRTDIICY